MELLWLWSALLCLPLLLLLAAAPSPVNGDLAVDTAALLRFRDAVDPRRRLNWNTSSQDAGACKWEGVECSTSNPPRIVALRLPGSALYGEIPAGSIGQLTELTSLSLRSNKLTGPLPPDLANLTLLRSVALQSNGLSGPIPDSLVSAWPRLVRLELAFNSFNGSIPTSLLRLTRLRFLYLHNNSLTGPLPAFNMSTLAELNVSNNRLSGSIPTAVALLGFPGSAFSGNVLCGSPLPPCFGADNTTEPSLIPPTPAASDGRRRRLSKGAIIGIAIASSVVLVLLLLFLLCYCFRRQPQPHPRTDQKSIPGNATKNNSTEFDSPPGPMPDTAAANPTIPPSASTTVVAPALMAQRVDHNKSTKLTFFESKRFVYDLEDLLRASAEVLGKGTAGTAYKAVLENGLVVVVKRLRDVGVERKEFERHMDLLGQIRHPNLAPIRAYYCSEDERLLVYDYMPMGSLSAQLHGNKGSLENNPLDWATLMGVTLSAARGIAHLHEMSMGESPGSAKLSHGNIKASNILLSAQLEAFVSDYGLTQVMKPTSAAAASKAQGYRAPEVTDLNKVTQKADVYSFGVVLLELLSGKLPSMPASAPSESGIDLARWVGSVASKKWAAEVLDHELVTHRNVEGEMLRMLHLAMDCVSPSPDQRPSMRQVSAAIQDIRQESPQ